MGLYGKMYVARASYDGLAEQITLETLKLFGFEQLLIKPQLKEKAAGNNLNIS